MEKKIEEKIFKKVKEEKNGIIKILENLVKIPTQNPPGENYEEFVTFAKNFIENPQEYPGFILLAELKKESLQYTLTGIMMLCQRGRDGSLIRSLGKS